ncbi:MAG: Ppx/GppA phosphatase family protein, partial [Ktedonobacterales bacterium]
QCVVPVAEIRLSWTDMAGYGAGIQLTKGWGIVVTSSQPLAAIDVGSNTIHQTVGRPTLDGYDLDYLADELELVRLGADVSASGALGQERMQRAISVIRHQTEVARQHGATLVLGIATEGVRAARNGTEFIERVRAETGVVLEVVTGEQEAALTYWGATSGLDGESGGDAVSAMRVVLDLGGGSMEVVVGEGSRVEWRVSLPLGSGAVHDRYAPADPPNTEELARAHDAVREALDALNPPLPVSQLIACGGTATTLAYLGAKAFPPLDPTELAPSGNGAVNGGNGALLRELTRERLMQLLDLLRTMNAAQVTERFGVEEARARLLGAGGVVLLATMEWLGVDSLIVRKRGIREGAILAYAHVGERWLELAASGEGW